MSRLHFSITLDDAEMSTLETALSRYLAACERELANGVYSPFYADQENITRIRSKLYDQVHTSAGLFSGKQLEEMARSGQLPKDFFEE